MWNLVQDSISYISTADFWNSLHHCYYRCFRNAGNKQIFTSVLKNLHTMTLSNPTLSINISHCMSPLNIKTHMNRGQQGHSFYCYKGNYLKTRCCWNYQQSPRCSLSLSITAVRLSLPSDRGQREIQLVLQLRDLQHSSQTYSIHQQATIHKTLQHWSCRQLLYLIIKHRFMLPKNMSFFF